jgi:hypothetical protein
MGKIEKTYRDRRLLLSCAFVCSCSLFWLFCFPKPPSSLSGSFPWRYFRHPLSALFMAAGALAALLLLFLFTRHVLFLASTRRDPGLRRAVDDERIRTGWLMAFRASFYVMVAVHAVYLFLEGRLYGWGLPHAAWVSSTTALMTLFGAALFYTREAKNEKL